MFYVTAKVGVMYAIFDNTDCTVEWYNKPQLDKILSANNGVVIQGYTPDNVSIQSGLTCDWHSCNWTKSRRNIFDVADKVTLTDNILTVFAESKKYKAKISSSDLDDVSMYATFSNGLNVTIPRQWVEKYM